MKKSCLDYDIVIIGGGMVGATLAHLMQNTPYRIALMDAGTSHPFLEDERLIALNESSISLFENSGLMEPLTSFATPIKMIHVSHRGHFGVTRIKASDAKLPQLGYVIPAKHINFVLFNALKQAKNIEIVLGATLQALTQTKEAVSLTINTLSGIKNVTADKVIGADGSDSTVRTLLGIETTKVDYGQHALVTKTQLQRNHENIAYERFLHSGAIAMLPLEDNVCATIWTDTRATISDLMKLNDVDFLSALQKQFGYRLGALKSISKRYVYPLQMLLAKEQIKERVVLIGNASRTLHPIAAQGLNVALYEAAALAHRLKENFSFPIFSKREFSRTLSHRLPSLFSADFFVVNRARQAGLFAFDLSPRIKKCFVEYAIGRRGDVPHLLLRKNE